MAAVITKIDPGSPGEKAGLRVGETLISIGGHPIHDVMDYKFYAYDPRLLLTVEGTEGARRSVSVHKRGAGPGAGV